MIPKIEKKIKIIKEQYFHQNKYKINESRKQYEINRYTTDFNFRIIRNTRSRIYYVLKEISRFSSTI